MINASYLLSDQYSLLKNKLIFLLTIQNAIFLIYNNAPAPTYSLGVFYPNMIRVTVPKAKGGIRRGLQIAAHEAVIRINP